MKELSPELQDINDKRKKLDDLFERMCKALNKSFVNSFIKNELEKRNQ